MVEKLSVRDVRPTQAELRRILRERRFVKGCKQQAWEEKQKMAWQCYITLRDGKQPLDRRERALRIMVRNEHGMEWLKSFKSQ